MIRCPTCGTFNQDSRKSCSNCGTTLPQTQIRCPNCGKLNSLGNILCDHCNARLRETDDVIPADLLDEPETSPQASQVKGISLPTRATSDTSNDDEAADDDLPDWLRSLTPDAEFFDGEAPEDDAAKDTAADEAMANDAVSDDFGEELTADDYSDWLSEILDDNPEFGAAPPGDEEIEAAGPVGDLTVGTDDLPSWFMDAAGDADEGEEDVYQAQGGTNSEAFESEFPDWLTTFADGSPLPTPSGEAETPPDWLLADVAEISVDPYARSDELPDWLLEMGTEGEAAEEQEGTTPSFPESELPDWLTSLTEDPTLADDASTPSPADSDTPPAEEAEEEEGKTPSFSESELPDWLTSLAEGATLGNEAEAAPAGDSETTPPAWDALEPLTEEEEEGDQIPETAHLGPEDGALPDWLADLDISEGTAEEAQAVFEEAVTGLSSAPPEERPAWLDELTHSGTSRAATEDQPDVPAFTTEHFQEEEVEETEEPEETSPLAPPLEEESSVPTWLHDLDLSDSGEPSTVRALAEEGDLPRADLPNWLQELAPGEFAIGQGTRVFEEGDDLVSADIPDWVKALQPSADREGRGSTPTQPFLPTPAEPEGPLQGIRGVLQPLTMVDMPTDTQPVAEVPVPEAVVSQAQLWRQLLEQPRMAERPISHETQRTPKGDIAMRLMVAGILILGLLGAFWLLPEELQLSSTSESGAAGMPTTTAPGAAQMIASLDSLQSGDGVILAVEYGNAHAAELAEVVAPILAHLDAQGAVVQAVSTLPEGVALGAGLLQRRAEGSDPADAPTDRVAYLPGNASGISNFLTHPDTTTQRHLVIISAHPERVRWWLEQTTLVNQIRETPLSVSVGLSASAAPHIAPYLRTSSVAGWLVGLPDALTYRALRSQGDTNSGLARLTEYGRVQDVLMLAHWAAGAFLMVGLLVNLVAGKKGTR